MKTEKRTILETLRETPSEHERVQQIAKQTRLSKSEIYRRGVDLIEHMRQKTGGYGFLIDLAA